MNKPHYGLWCGRHEYTSYQDIVLTKKASERKLRMMGEKNIPLVSILIPTIIDLIISQLLWKVHLHKLIQTLKLL